MKSIWFDKCLCVYFSQIACETFVTFHLVSNFKVTYVIEIRERSIGTFSHIVAYIEPCVTLEYLEHCHIENPGIFRTQHIFRPLSGDTLICSECCAPLAYWEPCYIQNFGIFRTFPYLGYEAYSETWLYRYIQAYSGIFNNHSYNNITFNFSL